MEYQIRHENGTLEFFNSFDAAFAAYRPSVWKISWDDENRWRPKTKSNLWLPQSEERLCLLSASYAQEPADSKTIYWVRQTVLPPNIDEIKRMNLTPSKKDIQISLSCIREVLSEKEFVKRFSLQHNT